MRHKISYRPQKVIWLKKIVSNTLAIGLLLNNGLISFASVLSDDGRYEYYNGNDIVIDDILEESEPQLELVGDTLFNIIDSQGKDTFIQSNIDYTRKRMFTCKNLKSNTTYTFEASISNISSDDTSLLKIYYTNMNENGTIADVYPRNYACKLINGRVQIVFTTREITCEETPLYLYVDNMGTSHGSQSQFSFESSQCVLVEGNYSNRNILYFEGVKSVGELENSIKINTSNKNLFDTSKLYIENQYGINNEAEFEVLDDSIVMCKKTERPNFVGTKVKVTKGKTYRFGFAIGEKTQYSNNLSMTVYSDKAWGNSIGYLSNLTNKLKSSTFIATTDEVFVGCYLYGNAGIDEIFEYKNVFVSEERFSDYNKYQHYNQEIHLQEPLRGTINGKKDKIIKRNGQWVIERNNKEIILDGSEKWYYNRNGETSLEYGFLVDDIKVFGDNVNDKFKSRVGAENNAEYIRLNDKAIVVSIFSTETNPSYIKEYLSSNPIKIVYELAEPIYEPIIFNPSNLYLNTTYIYSDTLISPEIKVVVDRTPNRAQESILIAESNPTVSNISKARYWSNLMRESILKDSFSEIINNITKVEDLKIEKKTISSNMDIYIKPENSLSMSLSTNHITFEGYSSVSDLDMDNAVKISVTSTLPYRLNSYLESEIQSEDGTSKIDKEFLHIKEDSDSEYKQFLGINQKLTLKEDCEAGKNNIHDIDFKLKASSHDTNIYRTVIKFEAEQK